MSHWSYVHANDFWSGSFTKRTRLFASLLSLFVSSIEMDDDTADIDAQIAQLEALKAKKLAKAAAVRERQEREDAKVLVGSTPTKPKREQLASRSDCPS